MSRRHPCRRRLAGVGGRSAESVARPGERRHAGAQLHADGLARPRPGSELTLSPRRAGAAREAGAAWTDLGESKSHLQGASAATPTDHPHTSHIHCYLCPSLPSLPHGRVAIGVTTLSVDVCAESVARQEPPVIGSQLLMLLLLLLLRCRGPC